MQLRAEMFNAFNYAQFRNPNGNAANRSSGLVGSSRQSRLTQMALKVVF